jgi:hypothetical protein
VDSLNGTPLSARQAEAQWLDEFRKRLFARHADAASWADRWVADNGQRILSQRLADPESVRRSPLLKIVRAHRGGLICYDRRYLDYPKNWDFKRFRIKHWHDYACSLCTPLPASIQAPARTAVSAAARPIHGPRPRTCCARDAVLAPLPSGEGLG